MNGMDSLDMVVILSFTTARCHARHAPLLPFSSLSKNRPGIEPDCHVVLVENRGLEPLTLGLQSRCSSQLS